MEKLHRHDLQMKSEPEVEAAPRAAEAEAVDNGAVAGLSQRQMRELDGDQAHAVADAGLMGGGQALPHADKIQSAFGRHDVSGVRAHTGLYASRASATLGAQAYTKGDQVAFASTPDLHTAAHEAAHVVQQRGGVHLKSGIGEAGDAYEQNADAVADAVVRGESAEPLLAQHAGPASTGGAVQAKAIQKIGVPLDQKLPEGQEAPAFGEVDHKQRKWSPEQYIAMWEQEQGRPMSDDERKTIKRGCIGITAANLNGGGNPLAYAEGIWGNFEQAHAAMIEKNKQLDADPDAGGGARYVVFAKLFWSNQSEKWEDRLNPDDKAFKPDPTTGQVDMSKYKYNAQSKWDVDPNTGKKVKSSYINFDYGFWDESSNCFWHANHMDYGDPERPMMVLQSTRAKFTAGYLDFDRIIFCIARAHNYDPGLAAIAHARGG
jgi:uncharacterized protein DUF4157/microbial transglutaminase